MGFYNLYPNRKDWRTAYPGFDSRNFDSSCCNHGGCSRCKSNRTFHDTKARIIADEKIKEYRDGVK
jgi:hypothetical protein